MNEYYNRKPIILVLEGDSLLLKTKSKLSKNTEGYYVLYFSGIDKNKMNIAVIESMTMKQYVYVNNKGVVNIPDCFNICDEIKISLITMQGDVKACSSSVFLYFNS